MTFQDTHEHENGIFRAKFIFLDIETTGLSQNYDEITMIGVHGGDGIKVFINSIDLKDLPQALKWCKVIVTFNGARFDLPFIEQACPVSVSTSFTSTCYIPFASWS